MIENVIKKFKSVVEFGKYFKIPKRTAYMWNQKGRTPPSWLPAIMLDAIKWRKRKDK